MAKKTTKEAKIEEKIEQMIDHEVYCCITFLMDDLLKYAEENPREAAIDIDEYWTKLNVCPECSCSNYRSFEDYKEEHPDFTVDAYNKEHPYDKIDHDVDYEYICDDCGTIFDEPETANVYEYWLVSEWAAKKLKAVGEIVLDTWIPIWCRCCTGQLIKMDYCWYKIAKDIVEYFEKFDNDTEEEKE